MSIIRVKKKDEASALIFEGDQYRMASDEVGSLVIATEDDRGNIEVEHLFAPGFWEEAWLENS